MKTATCPRMVDNGVLGFIMHTHNFFSSQTLLDSIEHHFSNSTRDVAEDVLVEDVPSDSATLRN